MPRGVRRVYEEALPRLRAEAQAAAIDAASFPHLEERAQKKIVRRIERVTGAAEARTVTPASGEELESLAAQSGIGIKLVGPAGDGDGGGC